MMTAKEWVAEHILGFERRPCKGQVGWGNISGDGVEMGFWCDWCGAKRNWVDPVPPCPKYPFPSFGLVDLMRACGAHNLPTFVRFDTLRPEGNEFTVFVGGFDVRMDTDDPLDALCQWLMDNFADDARG